MDSFQDGLTYIIPSMNMFEGYSFSLNGYESKVFWNIREAEDTDGYIRMLYEEYGSNGIRNFDKALSLLKLKPVYKALDALRQSSTLDIIGRLVNGKADKENERELLLILAEAYSLLYETYSSMEEATKGQLGLAPKDVNPQPVIKFVRFIGKSFGAKGPKVFPSWSSVDNTLPVMIAASLALIPFSTDTTSKSLMTVSDSLMLSHFFKEALDELCLDDNGRRELMHEAAFFIASTMLIRDEMPSSSPLEMFSCLLNDDSVMNLTGCNKYQDVVWYNKESMQKTILVCTLSYAASSDRKAKDVDEFARTLLEREFAAGYKLSALLKG